MSYTGYTVTTQMEMAASPRCNRLTETCHMHPAHHLFVFGLMPHQIGKWDSTDNEQGDAKTWSFVKENMIRNCRCIPRGNSRLHIYRQGTQHQSRDLCHVHRIAPNLGPAHIQEGWRPGAMGPKGPNQAQPNVVKQYPLTCPRSLIGRTANIQTGPELSEDR